MLDLITILGPTASGKTSLAVALAAHLDTEIISADSRQIYRSMDIGTGKDLSEYTYEGHAIPYHLIDICPPGYKYNLFEYIRDYNTAYADIIKWGKTPILCGGTGLYIEAVLKGYSLPPVPENKALREKLAEKSLSELEEILKNYKTLHNQTDTDTCKRAIRAIEIAEYYSRQEPEKLIPNPVKNALIIGVNIDGKPTRQNFATSAQSSRTRHGGRSSRFARQRHRSRISHLLRARIQVHYRVPHRAHLVRSNGFIARNSDSPIRQTANDMVQGYGASGILHFLARRSPLSR